MNELVENFVPQLLNVLFVCSIIVYNTFYMSANILEKLRLKCYDAEGFKFKNGIFILL
jgi:hypothetical protein